MDQKFVPATKTAHHYQGQINGKTYVVPHSTLDIYKKDGYAKPMRHAIVTSQAHVKTNNPNLNPEEIARVHEHIKNLHGGLEPAKLEEGRPIRGDVFHHHQTLVAKKTLRMPDAMVGVMGGQSKEEARAHLAKMGWTKKQIHDHEHSQAVTMREEYDYPDPGPDHPHQVGDTVHYRHGTNGHMTMGKVINRTHSHVIVQPTNSAYSYKIPHTDVVKNYRLQEEDTMLHEEIYHVWDHHGNKHEVSATSENEAKKKLISGHVSGEQVPMTQWSKIKIQKKLEERTLTTGETAKKEEIVHSLKPKLQSFKSRYGDEKGKSVMYAVATKQAKKLAEDLSESKKEEYPFRYHMDQVNRYLTMKTPNKEKAKFHFTQAIKHHAEGEKALKALKESEQLNELSDAAKQFIHHREEYWKHAKSMPVNNKQAKFHSAEMAKHHGNMTKAEKHIAHTGSYVSPPSQRLQGGSMAGDKEYVHENFMATYHRNENQNRHTENIVHLAKHFGTKADQDQAKFFADELKKHGHQPHHEAAYSLHQKLYPKALAAHEYAKASGRLSEEAQQIDELKRSTLANYVGRASSSLATAAYSSAAARQHERNVEHPISKAHFSKEAEKYEKKTAKREKGITRAASKLAEESQQLSELKMPKFGFAGKLFATTPRTVAHGVHSMGHEELKSLHKHYQERAPQSEIQKQQHRSIQKELKRRGRASVNKSQFVKKDLHEANHAYDVFHKGKNIDTVFYGHHEDPDSVKKSLVNHDGYHPDITVKKRPVKEHSETYNTVKEVLREMMTRKHFQQVADVIKAHPDAEKRKELAAHHAAIFKASNPRFDHKRFYAAAGVPTE